MYSRLGLLIALGNLSLLAGEPLETPKSGSTGSPDHALANTVVFQTAIELQRELLLHYASKQPNNAAIAYYLGINYLATSIHERPDDLESARHWLQKANSENYGTRAAKMLEHCRTTSPQITSIVETGSQAADRISPDEQLDLGEVEFTNRTIAYKAPLYNPLKWLAQIVAQKARHVENKPTYTNFIPAPLKTLVESCDISIAQFAGTDWSSHPPPDFSAQSARRLRNAIQGSLKSHRTSDQFSKHSLPRFENEFRDWIWAIAWVRMHEARIKDFAPATLDYALQTLNIAYKQTERHSIQGQQSLHLAWAGYIYYKAKRLDDLLYYPYQETMLPSLLPCQPVLDYASRLQAVQKLESPQLQNEQVVAVSHHSREDLLFGSTELEQDELAPESAAEQPASRKAIFLVIVATGALVTCAGLRMALSRGRSH